MLIFSGRIDIDICVKERDMLDKFLLYNKESDDKIISYILSDDTINFIGERSGNNILHILAKIGNIKLFETILKKKSSYFYVYNNNGLLPIHIAVMYSKYNIVKHFLDKSKDNYLKTLRKESILHLLVYYNNNVDIINDLILSYQLNPNVTNFIGSNIVHIASSLGKIDIVRCMLDNYINVEVENNIKHTPLYAAIEGDKIELVKILIDDYNASVDHLDIFDNSILHLAASTGNFKMLKYLLDNYQFKNINGLNKNHHTLIHYIIELYDIKDFEFLFDYGVNPYVLDKDGNSILYYSLIKSNNIKTNFDNFYYLVKRFPSLLNIINNKKESILLIASEFCVDEIVDYFLSSSGYLSVEVIKIGLCNKKYKACEKLIDKCMENKVSFSVSA